MENNLLEKKILVPSVNFWIPLLVALLLSRSNKLRQTTHVSHLLPMNIHEPWLLENTWIIIGSQAVFSTITLAQGAFRFECYAYPGHYLAFFPPTHLRVGRLSIWLHQLVGAEDRSSFFLVHLKNSWMLQGVTKGHNWNERKSSTGLAVLFMNLGTSFFFLFVGSLCFFQPNSSLDVLDR